MWKDKSDIYLHGNMTGMTEVKHDLMARSPVVQLRTKNAVLCFLRVNKSMILHVLHINYQETR